MSGDTKETGVSIHDDAGKELEDSLMEDMMEAFLPKILPKLEPAFRKLAGFLNAEDDKKWLILQANPKDGTLHLMILKKKYLEKFEVADTEEGKDPYVRYPIDEFLKVLMEGDIETIMDTVKKEADKL